MDEDLRDEVLNLLSMLRLDLRSVEYRVTNAKTASPLPPLETAQVYLSRIKELLSE